MENILITGGTGLVGQELTHQLRQKNYTVSYLSRSNRKIDGVKVYQWDLKKGQIEEEALREASHIIHLAGAGVADKSWTHDRKKIILESRTESSNLLYTELKRLDIKPKSFISASAIGYYGLNTGNTLLEEESPVGDDFLADVTRLWESAVDQVATLDIRTVKLRIGIVLSRRGGALEKIAQPIRFGAGAALGSGAQYMSWIHIEDLCRMFIHAIENEQLSGVYNAVASHPVTNAEFTRLAAKALNRPLWLPHVPEFALKLMLGEMAGIVLGGNKVSNKKILGNGFSYQYTEAKQALDDLL